MLSFRRWSALMLCALLSSIVPVGAHPVAGVAGVVTPQLNRPEAHPETLTFHPPVRPAAAPSLTLQVTVAPMTLVVGDTATVTVRVTNQGAGSAHGLALRLPRPDGAATDSAARDGWRWTAAELASQATATFSASLRLATLPRGAALVLNPELSAQELVQPLRETAGTVVWESATPLTATAVAGRSATLTDAAGRMAVELPSQASASDLTVTLRPTRQAAPAALFRLGAGFGMVTLSATSAGRTVTTLPAGTTLRLGYTEEQLRALGLDATHLTIYQLQPGKAGRAGQWAALPTTLDPTSRTVVARVMGTGNFQLGSNISASAAFLPSVQGWQVSSFTGAASYSYPLDLPAGPAGIKPSLQLSYSSAATDGGGGMRPKQQSSWVGKGWSLDTSAIAQNKLPNGEEYYALTLNGQSFDLLKGAALVSTPGTYLNNWTWEPTNQSFIKVRAIATAQNPAHPDFCGSNLPCERYTWQVWTKDGVRYDFNDDLWWGWKYCMGGSDDSAWLEAYKWQLTQATDPHGNTIHYTYGHASQNLTEADGCYHVSGTVDYDSWLSSITWGGNATQPDRYRVDFTVVDRVTGLDTQYDQSDNQFGITPHATKQLDHITVQSNSSNPFNAAQWQEVRQYWLGYAPLAQSLYPDKLDNSTGPYLPDGNYRKLTLQTITRVGMYDSGQPMLQLPATTFSYGTTYASSNPDHPNFPGGNFNRLIGLNNGQGGTLDFTYETIGSVMTGTNPNPGKYLNNHRVTTKTVTSGPVGASYRQSATWSYSYGAPANNWLGPTDPTPQGGYLYGSGPFVNSAALYYNYYSDSARLDAWPTERAVWLAHPQDTEFRGHSYTVEIAPSGAQTKHWFYQGDTQDLNCPVTAQGGAILSDPCFKQLRNREFLLGREWKTESFSAPSSGNRLLGQTISTFAVDDANVNYQFQSQAQLSGLWSAFTYEQTKTSNVWDGLTTPATTMVKSIYDDTLNQNSDGNRYGNLSRTEEYDGATLVRATSTSYTILERCKRLSRPASLEADHRGWRWE